MSSEQALLLIPVENQVREFDPKLLLACVAARHGFSSVIGSRRELEMNIDAFPRAIYLSKSMTVRSLLFFRIARRLGHQITTWDEEALVHLPSEVYFSRRLDRSSIKYVRNLFAWGVENAELWRHYPDLPRDTPIHAVGNPRTDMLRSEVRAFYQEDAARIRRKYGAFILVNTNFNHVNAFGPDMNLFRTVKRPGKRVRFGRAARGMSWDYAKGLWDHKQAVFRDFQALIPILERRFPGQTIVVRPHPTENSEVYQEIARRCQRVCVTNEGNIVPWLMATKALVHNGCTTGVEAYVLGVPAISYRASVNELYDDGFYRLPNRLSHQCFDIETLGESLQQALDGELGPARGLERQTLFERYVAAREGPLACERIVALLKRMYPDQRLDHSLRTRTERWLIEKALRLARRVHRRLPGTHNRPAYQRHRFPRIAVDEVRRRLARLQQQLGYHEPLQVKKVSDVIFRIEA